MRKKILLFLMLATTVFGMGKACGKKPSGDNFKPNKAELGQNWQQFRHDASQNVWVFRDEDGYQNRPQMHQKPGGAQVFWNGTVTDEEHDLINSGLSEMLAMCRPKFQYWLGKDVFSTFYFNKVSDYKVIQVVSPYTIQEGEARGCGGIITGAHGDCGGGTGTCTAAGTVGGLNDRWGSSSPGGEGGVYIIVAKQSPEQMANPACKAFIRNAVRNEGEHVLFSNVPQTYFAFANDGAPRVGNHPYCALPNSTLLEMFRKTVKPELTEE